MDFSTHDGTHRSAEGSRIRVNPGIRNHKIRLELTSSDPKQEASVILAYPNLHICPWVAKDLPNVAKLPSM